MKNALLCLTLLVSSIAFSQLNMTTEQVYGKELEINFNDYLNIEMIFKSDTEMYWVERNSGTDANEKINTIHINKHTTFTQWAQSDKTVVSLYSDFSAGTAYGYQYHKNRKITKLIGTIKLKQTTPLLENNKDVTDIVHLESDNKNSEISSKKPTLISVEANPPILENSPAVDKLTVESNISGLYPEASSKLLTLSDIESLNTAELKIMRNEIFARYGHSFMEGGKMDLYFKKQSWYTSKNLNATSFITEIEKQNIALIKSLE